MTCSLSVGTNQMGNAERTSVPDHLGSQILGRATECVGLSILYFLGKPKVDQLKVSLGVYEYILGLQVAVCNAFPLVKEL